MNTLFRWIVLSGRAARVVHEHASAIRRMRRRRSRAWS
jgi:hypothetical protein